MRSRAVLLATLLVAQPLAAQSRLAGAARVIAPFALGTLAAAPFDRDIARAAQRQRVQAAPLVRHSARLFNTLGDPGTVVLSAALYGVGRLGGLDRTADLGFHMGEAVLASGAVTGAVKGLMGRERPSSAGIGDADDFTFGHGFSGNAFESFPSGHTTAAFAAATVLTLESRRWWPAGSRWVGIASYTVATLVGAARVYSNAHWASDVVMGAGVGTLAGYAVTRHGHPSGR